MNYNAEWLRSLERFRTWNERAVWAAFAHLGRPRSFLDLGCGDGWMVRTARMSGAKPAIGVELSPDIRKLRIKWAKILTHDLSTPLDLGQMFDLVVSIEVGEHMPEAASDLYVRNVVRHVGKHLVFTAAAPGQGGDGHINCQPQEYWRDKIQSLGLHYNQPTTERLRESWKWCTGPMFWLPQNLQVFSEAGVVND